MTYFPMLFQENPSQKFSYVYVSDRGGEVRVERENFYHRVPKKYEK